MLYSLLIEAQQVRQVTFRLPGDKGEKEGCTMTSHKINIGKAVYSVKQREDGTFNAYNCSTLREVKSENTMHKVLKALAERDHTEALEINEAIDSMIAARQHIANKKPDFSQETWDLVRLGNSYKEAGREWYRWAKATALRLWENRLTQRQLFQML